MGKCSKKVVKSYCFLLGSALDTAFKPLFEKCFRFIKKLNLDFNVINDETIIELCECNNYADKVYHRIKCIELNDPNADEDRKSVV